MRIFCTSLLIASLFCFTHVNAQSRAVTFSFSHTTTADFTDFGTELTDGEGGIPDVPGVTYQIFFTNAAGTPDGTVRFYGYGNHSGDDNSIYLDGREGYLYPIGQQDGFGPPAYQMVLQTADGSEFSFKSIYLANYSGGTAAQQSFDIIGFRNGVSTGQVTAHAENAQFGLMLTQATVLTPAVFQNVDRVVIRPTAASEFADNFWYGINDIGFDNPAATLPVRFVSFDAFAQNGAVLLNWKTAQEEDNSHFVVERSVDGHRFEALGRVAAIAGSNAASYTYEDRQPLAGKNYYRLVQHDRNGNRSISATRMVENQYPAFFSLYPNPATVGSVLSVGGRLAGPVRVQVINAAGQAVYTRHYPAAENGVSLSTASLAPGLYKVVVKANGIVHTKSLLLLQ
jgi:hypothetical protein